MFRLPCGKNGVFCKIFLISGNYGRWRGIKGIRIQLRKKTSAANSVLKFDLVDWFSRFSRSGRVFKRPHTLVTTEGSGMFWTHEVTKKYLLIFVSQSKILSWSWFFVSFVTAPVLHLTAASFAKFLLALSTIFSQNMTKILSSNS
jgi:hypothetical protein